MDRVADGAAASQAQAVRVRRIVSDATLLRWAPRLYLAGALGLVPWVVYLALTLPRHSTATHYRLAWVGFDLLLVGAMARTAWLGWHRRPEAELTAAVTASLLIVDAWFDVTTAPTGRDLLEAVVLAGGAELPAAAAALFLVRRTQRILNEHLRVAAEASAAAGVSAGLAAGVAAARHGVTGSADLEVGAAVGVGEARADGAAVGVGEAELPGGEGEVTAVTAVPPGDTHAAPGAGDPAAAVAADQDGAVVVVEGGTVRIVPASEAAPPPAAAGAPGDAALPATRPPPSPGTGEGEHPTGDEPPPPGGATVGGVG